MGGVRLPAQRTHIYPEVDSMHVHGRITIYNLPGVLAILLFSHFLIPLAPTAAVSPSRGSELESDPVTRLVANLGPSVAEAAPSPLLLPFSVGESWYVCQGYFGTISHRTA